MDLTYNTSGTLIRLVISILCGALVGWERERRHKPAGLRTHILIGFGATIYMIISELVSDAAGLGRSDRARIASQVVPGVGFLCAGTIIRAQGGVHGLTTAASIWLVAAVGLAAGAGYVVLAVFCAVLAVVILWLLPRPELPALSHCTLTPYHVRLRPDDATRQRLRRLLEHHGVNFESASFRESGEDADLTLPVCLAHDRHRAVLADLWSLEGVREVRGPEARTP